MFSASSFLEQQQVSVDTLFAAIDGAPMGRQRELAVRLVDTLLRQMIVAEETFHPRALGARPQLTSRASDAYAGIRARLLPVLAAQPGSAAFFARIEALRDVVQDAWMELQNGSLAAGEAELTEDESAELASEMIELNAELLHETTPSLYRRAEASRQAQFAMLRARAPAWVQRLAA